MDALLFSRHNTRKGCQSGQQIIILFIYFWMACTSAPLQHVAPFDDRLHSEESVLTVTCCVC